MLVELVGRLVGKQGWTFEDSREDGDPYRLQLGKGEVVEGLERALVGARVGEVRRTVVPSKLAYVDRVKEPVRDPESARWREVVPSLADGHRRSATVAGLPEPALRHRVERQPEDAGNGGPRRRRGRRCGLRCQGPKHQAATMCGNVCHCYLATIA